MPEHSLAVVSLRDCTGTAVDTDLKLAAALLDNNRQSRSPRPIPGPKGDPALAIAFNFHDGKLDLIGVGEEVRLDGKKNCPSRFRASNQRSALRGATDIASAR